MAVFRIGLVDGNEIIFEHTDAEDPAALANLLKSTGLVHGAEVFTVAGRVTQRTPMSILATAVVTIRAHSLP